MLLGFLDPLKIPLASLGNMSSFPASQRNIVVELLFLQEPADGSVDREVVCLALERTPRGWSTGADGTGVQSVLLGIVSGYASAGADTTIPHRSTQELWSLAEMKESAMRQTRGHPGASNSLSSCCPGNTPARLQKTRILLSVFR